VAEVRELGSRVLLISDGDVAGAIATAWRTRASTSSSASRHARGVIAAAALQGLGGEIQGVLIARDDESASSPSRSATTSIRCFATTTSWPATTAILRHRHHRRRHPSRVRFHEFGATTQSLVVRSRSGTVRTIETFHRHDKLQEFSIAGF